MKLVLVEWEDSTGFDEGTWVLKEKIEAELGTSLHMLSVGWMLKETDKSVLLASHIDYPDRKLEAFTQASGIIEIPRRAIYSIIPLTKSRRKCSPSTQSPPLQITSSQVSADTLKIKLPSS